MPKFSQAIQDASRRSSLGKYGSVDMHKEYGSDIEDIDNLSDTYEEEQYQNISGIKTPNKRWSVIEKFDRRYVRRYRTCWDCWQSVTYKCMMSTLMLAAFLFLAWYFTRTLLFSLDFDMESYDFIIVGAGPAGSVVAKRLIDAGASVLLLEAGDNTQIVNGNSESSTLMGFDQTSNNENTIGSSNRISSISQFDIPLLWSSVAQEPSMHFGPFNALNINVFRGAGGGAVQSAMLYLRAVKLDIYSWDTPGWRWSHIENAFSSVEQYGQNAPLPSSISAVSTRKNNKSQTRTIENSVISSSSSSSKVNTNDAGYIPIQANRACQSQDALAASFLSAAAQAGERVQELGFNAASAGGVLREEEDGGGQRAAGVGCFDLSVDRGMRLSPAKLLLEPYLQSRRLNLLVRARVRRILLSKEDGTVGKEEEERGEDTKARADLEANSEKEVVGTEFVVTGGTSSSSSSTTTNNNSSGDVAAAPPSFTEATLSAVWGALQAVTGSGAGAEDTGNGKGKGKTHGIGRGAAGAPVDKAAADALEDSIDPLMKYSYRAIGVEYETGGGGGAGGEREVRFAYLAVGPPRGGTGASTSGASASSNEKLDFQFARGVVLAAGAIMTPTILMNSGIGPPAALKEAGVKVKVHNEEVGRNLQDHVAVGLTFQPSDFSLLGGTQLCVCYLFF
jgi:choline dehydrogenase-like flavoprotein